MVSFGRNQKRKRREEKGRRRRGGRGREEEEEEEEEEEKKKGTEGERNSKRYGTMTTSMDTCFGLYGATFDIWISCLVFDLSRVLLEFHPNLRFLEIRVGKTPYGIR